jgi:DNA polymerase-3 subunit alpha
VAKKFGLKKVFLEDSSFCGFISFYKQCQKENIEGYFGIELVAYDGEKDEESRKTESKVIIWLKNSDAYRDGIRMFSEAATNGFYYYPRITWTKLQEMFTENLSLMITSFSGFLARNLLEDYICNPNFGNIKPILTYSTCGLPFDGLIENTVKKYAESNNLEVMQVHPIYYFSEKDAKPYLIRRCIEKRSKWSTPNLNHFSSDNFSWESYCKLVGIDFK